MKTENLYKELLELKKDCYIFDQYNKIIDIVTDELRKETASNKGAKVSDIAIIKRITKESRKNPIYAEAHKFELNGIEYFGFCEGHYILASNNDFEYTHAENPMDLARMCDIQTNIEITIDKKDVQLFIKMNPKKNKVPYIFENENIRIGFNPYFLLDVINFVGNNTFLCSKPKAPAIVYSKDKTKIGLILPISLPKN